MEFTEEQKKRFWDKVDKTDSCWRWTGSTNTYGYGQVTINSKKYGTHRVSWLLAGYTISDGHILRHKCRNRNCVNPDHLETGTVADNMADKLRDGTSGKGERHPSVKLTESQVLEIRASIKSQNSLAKEYGVSAGTIQAIVERRTWKHV